MRPLVTVGSGYSETDLDPRRFLTLFERVLCRNRHLGQAACQCCSASQWIINHCCIPSGRHKVDGPNLSELQGW